MSSPTYDVIIVGGGAAGLATAIFAARAAPAATIAVVDGAPALGAKILVSGGGRCNVTNRWVTEHDFNGGSPALLRRVLRGFPVDATVAFFAGMGVPLHEEALGKLFPDTNRARTVLDALLVECRALGVAILTSRRVTAIASDGNRFEVASSGGPLSARAAVLATGGRSLPRTGSDGLGYELARSLGHTVVPTTPALVPLLLEGSFHAPLTGVSAPVELTMTGASAKARRIAGSLLFTHFGVSGPAALNLSRHWLRARLEGANPAVFANHWPGATFLDADTRLCEAARSHPRARVSAALARVETPPGGATTLRDNAHAPPHPRLPAALAEALVAYAGIAPEVVLADLARDARRRLAHALTALPLAIVDSRGYNHAEVTAGGIGLREVDVGTMQSRRCDRLFLVGEVLDVDGRLGGFNFQWAWATAWVAGRGIAATLK